MSSEKANQAYRPPVPELGADVYWYPGGDKSKPHAAKVVRIGHDSLNLIIFMPDNYNHGCRDGVRHVGDPRARQDDLKEQGAWDFTPSGRELAMLKDQVRALTQRVGTQELGPEKKGKVA